MSGQMNLQYIEGKTRSHNYENDIFPLPVDTSNLSYTCEFIFKISNLVFARLPWLDTSCKFVHTPRTSLLPCCMRHHVLSLDHLLHRPRLCILCRNSRLFPDDVYSKGKAEKNWRWRYCLVTWAVWPIRTDTGDQFEAWWCNELRLSLCICISFLETPKNAVDYEYSTASWLYVPSLIGTLKTLIDISWLSVHESTRMSSSSQSL